MHFRKHQLDITSVTDREDIIEAFGHAAMWRATIAAYTRREAAETDPRRKRRLRLMLSNAQTQLSLITNEGA